MDARSSSPSQKVSFAFGHQNLMTECFGILTCARFGHAGIGQLSNLKELILESCYELESLPESEFCMMAYDHLLVGCPNGSVCLILALQLQVSATARRSRTSTSTTAIICSPSQKVSVVRASDWSDARTLRTTDLHLFLQPSASAPHSRSSTWWNASSSSPSQKVSLA